jgi:hypothetical protein
VRPGDEFATATAPGRGTARTVSAEARNTPAAIRRAQEDHDDRVRPRGPAVEQPSQPPADRDPGDGEHRGPHADLQRRQPDHIGAEQDDVGVDHRVRDAEQQDGGEEREKGHVIFVPGQISAATPIYALSDPLGAFDALTSVSNWSAAAPVPRTPPDRMTTAAPS